jgi:membrane protease YdiL (CAAX protease family)
VGFHYFVRADAVGVRGRGAVWFPLTGPVLSPLAHFSGAALLLGIVPVVLARLVWRMPLGSLGLGLGCRRRGLAWLALGVPLAVIAGAMGAGSTAVRAVYPLDPTLSTAAGPFLAHALTQFLYFAAWEVLFRGVLLFGLRQRLGDGPANLVQTALSVTAHFGRPLDETLAALPAGLLFGAVDLRIGSVWYVAMVHWVVGVSLDWFVLHHAA